MTPRWWLLSFLLWPVVVLVRAWRRYQRRTTTVIRAVTREHYLKDWIYRADRLR
jgi:hypothetical protein